MDMGKIIKAVIVDRTAQATAEDITKFGFRSPEEEEHGRVSAADDETLADIWRSISPMGTNFGQAMPLPSQKGGWIVGMYITRSQMVDRIVSLRTKQKDY